MPMPHRTFAQVAKRRLVGTEGRERIRVVDQRDQSGEPLLGVELGEGGQRLDRRELERIELA